MLFSFSIGFYEALLVFVILFTSILLLLYSVMTSLYILEINLLFLCIDMPVLTYTSIHNDLKH